MVVFLIATLTIGFQVAGWIRVERDRAIRNAGLAQEAEQNAQQSLRRALEAERDANVRGHLTQAIVQRKRDMQGRRVRGVHEIEQAIALAPSDSMRHELRNELVAALALTDTVPAKVWDSPHGNFAVDHQFKNYARETRDGTISVRRMQDDQELCRLQRPPGPDNRAWLKFSPDGAYIASFTFDQHVLVWKIEGGELVLDDFGCCWEFAFDFTPDSRAIVVGHDHEVVVHELHASEVRSRWPIDFIPWCVSCGPTGDQVAICPEENSPLKTLQVFCWSTRERIAEYVAPNWVFDVSWHPKGKVLAVGCNDTNIYLWEVGTAQPYRKISGSLAHGVRVSYSHDGTLLASSSWGQEFYLWDADTGTMLCSARHSMLSLQFSPDDQQIALFQDGPQIGTYEIIRSETFRYTVRGGYRNDGNSLLNAAFTPDGKILMVGTDKGLSVHEYPSGEERAFAPIGKTTYLSCDAKGNLWTSGRTLLRWPIHSDAELANRFVVGPPEPLPISTQSEFDISRDGTVLIVADYEGRR